MVSGFDVIAFASAPISWAACYEGHLTLLEGASRPLTGRQNGRRAYRPNSASTGCMRLQVCLPLLLSVITCHLLAQLACQYAFKKARCLCNFHCTHAMDFLAVWPPSCLSILQLHKSMQTPVRIRADHCNLIRCTKMCG